MAHYSLQTQERTVQGRKVQGLRRQGIVPAHVYGSGFKSRSIQVEAKNLRTLLKEVGETTLIDLFIEKEKLPVLVQNVQRNPIDGTPIHVDFYQVNLKEEVTAEVAVEMVGESPAEKSGAGTAVLHVNAIEVTALPADLPDKFEVDISELSEVDQAVYVSDLKVDRNKVTINVDPETIVVKVEAPSDEPEPEESSASAAVDEAKPENSAETSDKSE